MKTQMVDFQRFLGCKFLPTLAFFSLLIASCVTKKKPLETKPTPVPTAAPTASPTPEPKEEGFEKASWSELQGVGDLGDLGDLNAAVEQSLVWTQKQKSDRELNFGKKKIALSRIAETLSTISAKLASKPSQEEFRAFLEGGFELWKVVPSEGKNFMATGYYIPKIQGSQVQTPEFRVPVYGVPSDLISVSLGEFDEKLAGRSIRGRRKGNSLVPYFERDKIRNEESLLGRSDVLTWVRDEWDVFLVEVQGSGVVVEGGKEWLLAYADQNGRSYRAVGKLLLQENKIPKEKISMQAIGQYLKANPQEMRRVLDYNPSFVFFEKSDGLAKGSLGVPLTSARSVAVDFSRFPQAAFGFLNISKDDPQKVDHSVNLQKYVVAQDTGGAIRGLGRMDFFWGYGDAAGEQAGIMQHRGEFFLILKKPEN